MCERYLAGVQDFRTFLHGWLRSSGWNVPRLSSASGIADPVIRRWLVEGHGAQRPSPASLKKLAPVLGVESSELLRIAGYVPDAATAGSNDPRLAVVTSRWETLPRGLQDAILVLASHQDTTSQVHSKDLDRHMGERSLQTGDVRSAKRKPVPSRSLASMEAEFGRVPLRSVLSGWLNLVTGWLRPQLPLPA